MADSANVQSIEAIRDIRDALVVFMEDAKNALNDTDFDLRRTSDWLTHEQRLYWTAEVRRRGQDVADARSALQRKELGKATDTSVEDKMLRIARSRLAEAEEKVEIVRRWLPEMQRASHEYRSQAYPLGDMINGDLQNALAKLSRMIESLENYLRLQAPSTPQAAPTGFSASSSSGASAAAPSAPRTAPAAPQARTTSEEAPTDEQRIEPLESRDEDVAGEVG
jgi:hypothetical protein